MCYLGNQIIPLLLSSSWKVWKLAMSLRWAWIAWLALASTLKIFMVLHISWSSSLWHSSLYFLASPTSCSQQVVWTWSSCSNCSIFSYNSMIPFACCALLRLRAFWGWGAFLRLEGTAGLSSWCSFVDTTSCLPSFEEERIVLVEPSYPYTNQILEQRIGVFQLLFRVVSSFVAHLIEVTGT